MIITMILFGVLLVFLLLAAGVFLAGRKLWRDKKNGRTCCGGSGCTCCSNCKKEKKGL